MAALTLGEKLKALRQQHDWLQADLAKAAKMTQPAISRLERDEVRQPRLAVLKQLAEALQTSVDYLVGTTGGTWVNRTTDMAARKLLDAYQRFSPADQKQLLDYARFLTTQGKRIRRKTRTG